MFGQPRVLVLTIGALPRKSPYPISTSAVKEGKGMPMETGYGLFAVDYSYSE